ncbi:telomere repeat-binding factor 4-like [Gossypium australe]|uniref:Telomere repeat-binding factor 4-like n=1 Tax=Gossypium australe TaxID=47621 RepID=A0A5B6XBT9_9ROSI|nr:telomere repeat-binding factor 4-like [Gossypium australe]
MFYLGVPLSSFCKYMCVWTSDHCLFINACLGIWILTDLICMLQQRHEVPPNFRRLLSSRLRRLVSQGKLEKVQNCYKIREDTLMGTETPTPKQKDVRLRQNSGAIGSGETVEEAAITTAYTVAEAENKSFLAAEAVKEAERVSKMAEDTDSMLQLVKEIYEQCSRGETVILNHNNEETLLAPSHGISDEKPTFLWILGDGIYDIWAECWVKGIIQNLLKV